LHTSQENHSIVLKITTTMLSQAKWNLSITLDEARRSDAAVTLSESQVLRWIDELNGVHTPPQQLRELRRRVATLRQEEASTKSRNEIKRLYREIDELRYKPDYLLLVVEKIPDYRRACKGFTVNGVKYARLVGTNGGVKSKTIVFVSDRLAPELRRRMDNGRSPHVAHVPAKLEAYRALACSATTPVSLPRGILVVPDCETEFTEDVITISDSESGIPSMEYVDGATVQLNESDGYGLMCPALAARWSEELELGYVSSGFNTRFSFEKGMVFAFDFHRFAREVGGCAIVKDIWGNEVNIANVELILTASMLKLWSSYDSCEHYLRCCTEHRYSFCVTKTCPEALESWRNTNYQFLQSYELSDADIDELIQPTVDRIRDVIHGDWRKAVLFLGGDRPQQNNAFCTALAIEPRMHNDPFLRDKLLRLIHGEIDDAKIGAVGVHGNYSVVSGDPYSLCQSIFGLPVTGLLRAGKVSNQYWADLCMPQTVAFRAPMTCHNNISVVNSADRPEVRDWYAHMRTCTVINSWDSMAHALNGMAKTATWCS
jgi:glutathione S-transferase